jgi:hypothetical protein
MDDKSEPIIVVNHTYNDLSYENKMQSLIDLMTWVADESIRLTNLKNIK